MNKNSLRNYKAAAKEANKGSKAISVAILKILSGRGESASWVSYIKTFNFQSVPRKSQYPKVARKAPKMQKNDNIE